LGAKKQAVGYGCLLKASSEADKPWYTEENVAILSWLKGSSCFVEDSTLSKNMHQQNKSLDKN
jgi:hypothetical protein